MDDFQLNLLKFLTQSKQGKQYLNSVDSEIFDDVGDQVVYDLYKEYYTQYKLRPSKANFKEYLRINLHKDGITEDVREYVFRRFGDIYEALPIDEQFIEEQVVIYVKKQHFKETLKKYGAGVLDNANEDQFKQLYKDISRIHNIGVKQSNHDVNMLDNPLWSSTKTQGNPCCFPALNDMTAAGGFYTPQLITFAGAPKSFKTGIMMRIAIGYWLSGFNVFWADIENGIDNLKIRIAQHFLNATRSEVLKGDSLQIYLDIIRGVKEMGAGDMYLDYFRAGKDNVSTVDNKIEMLYESKGFEPNVIFYDYLDKFGYIHPHRKERRLMIQDNYYESVIVNEARSTFAFTVSKIGKEAFKKEFIELGDIGEDIEKLYNAHASFAINGTPDEVTAGFRRLSPLVQREGIGYTKEVWCPLVVDMAKGQCEEEVIED